jgi:hypothetical protein
LLLFDQSFQDKVERSLWEKKERERIHYYDDDDDCSTTVFLDIFLLCFVLFSSFFFFSPFLYPYFYHVYVQDRPIDQTIILCSIEFLNEEYCLEIECRPMRRPGSVLSHGSLSIHMLSLVHFHRNIRLNILLVVVSAKKKRKRVQNGDLRVSADDCRGHSMFAYWRVQTINIFSFSFSFCWSIFAFVPYSFVHIYSYSCSSNVINRQLLIIRLSYLFLRE